MVMRTPKNYDRIMLISRTGGESQSWMKVAFGINSRGVNINEETKKYYYMSGHGACETEVSGQDYSVTISGNRVIGDPAQDLIFEELLFDIDNREVEFMDFDAGADVKDTKTAKPNGWRGKGTIQITDPGSGDARERQNIGFILSYKGKPERGIVSEESGAFIFTPAGGVLNNGI